MRWLPLLFIVLSAGPAFAADPVRLERRADAEDGKGTFTATFENDKIAGTDRQYTNGFSFSYLSATTEVPEFLYGVRNAVSPLIGSGGAVRSGFAFGQNLYTPDDTQRRTLIADDRPYAAWTYLTFSLLSDTGTRLDTLALDLGWIGTAALGEEVQNNWHRLIGVPTAKGWENQLHNEPGVNLTWERRWRRGGGFDVADQGVDMTPHVAASLGNVFTHAATGVAFRLGHDLPSDYGPPRIRSNLAPGGFFGRPADNFGWYVFAGVEGRAVLRDITLDGNSFQDSHNVNKEPFVGEAQLGLVLTLYDYRLAFTYVTRTQEFDGQDRMVRFGGMALSTRF